MINIGSFHPPVSANKASKYRKVSKSTVVTGAEVNNNSPKLAVEEDRRGRQDRRKRNLKPLIDMRSGHDRRHQPGKPSINIKV